jgi:DNA-binding MarR family transcriptional regulator
MSEVWLLSVQVRALEAALEVMRGDLAILQQEQEGTTRPSSSAVQRARAIHPQLGPRQAEVITALEEHGSQGTSTGAISRAIGYDEANVYLTLRGLIRRRFVEKDTMTDPHTYRLAGRLLEG